MNTNEKLNYKELKERENQLSTDYNNLSRERSSMMDLVYKFSYTNPDLVPEQILNRNLEKIEIHTLVSRLNIIIDNIENSDLPESEKESAIEMVSRVRAAIRENVKQADKIYDKQIKLAAKKSERGIELSEKNAQIEKLEAELKEIDKQITNYEEWKIKMQNDGISSGVIGELEKDIASLKEQRQEKEAEINNIKSEPGLEEELKVFAEDQRLAEKRMHSEALRRKIGEQIRTENALRNKELEERNKPEETKKEQFDRLARELNEIPYSIEEEKTEEKSEEKNGKESEETSKNGEEKTSEEVKKSEESKEEKDPLDPIKPEKAKKPKKVHKASPELINKIKKFGGKALGITAIGIAIAAFIVNPLAVGAALAAGKVAEVVLGSPKK